MKRPWRQDGSGDAYQPSVDPRTQKKVIRRIELSARATREIYEQTDPSDDEAFITVDFNGMLRAEGYMFRHLDNALAVAMEENLIIHYCKRGLPFRVTWKQDQLPQRTEDNYILEDVVWEPDLSDMEGFEIKKLRSVFKGLKNEH